MLTFWQSKKEPLKEAPEFSSYFPTVSMLNDEQSRFYRDLRRNLAKHVVIDIEQNISYIFCYCYELLSSNDLRKVHDEMVFLSNAYASHKKLEWYCSYWSIDALIGMGQLMRALTECKPLPLDRSGSLRTDTLLSIRHKLKLRVAGRDAFTIDGPKVTSYARKYLGEVCGFLDAILESQFLHGEDIISNWISTYNVDYRPFYMFSGSPACRPTEALNDYWFSRTMPVLADCRRMTREAENTFREERGIPKIGEGWIAETELYYKVKQAFPHWNVVHHARPEWLGGQHLDIYIEQARVAIEYQGSQHFTPIAFFGGEAAYQKTRARDKRKKRLCGENGLLLIYAQQGYRLEDLLRRISDNESSRTVL